MFLDRDAHHVHMPEAFIIMCVQTRVAGCIRLVIAIRTTLLLNMNLTSGQHNSSYMKDPNRHSNSRM